MVKNNETNNNFHGFNAGLAQVRMGDYKTVIAELWTALGVNNRNSFYNYRDGKTQIKAVQAEAVQGVFNRFGVTKNIWG